MGRKGINQVGGSARAHYFYNVSWRLSSAGWLSGLIGSLYAPVACIRLARLCDSCHTRPPHSALGTLPKFPPCPPSQPAREPALLAYRPALTAWPVLCCEFHVAPSPVSASSHSSPPSFPLRDRHAHEVSSSVFHHPPMARRVALLLEASLSIRNPGMFYSCLSSPSWREPLNPRRDGRPLRWANYARPSVSPTRSRGVFQHWLCQPHRAAPASFRRPA